MNYNIHPIIVHFPIAMLFVYSFIKILPFRKWLPKISWSNIEIVLLLVGVLGAWASSATGETAEHLVRPNREVLSMHKFFAGASTWIYGLLLAGELLPIVSPKILERFNYFSIGKILNPIQKILSNIYVLKILSLFGFIAILMTGLLGGVMVYGTTADPIAGVVLKILGITL